MSKLDKKILVVKFGGTSLSTPWKIKKAAESVKLSRNQGNEVCVVVSALEKTTDRLELLCDFFGLQAGKRDSILSSGETLSAQVFAEALEKEGVSSRVFLPSLGDWPILTNSDFCSARVLDESEKLVNCLVKPLLKSSVPVIPGFIGKDKRGNLTTLGRGSSDITLLYLGKCLGADEIIKVTDVAGVRDEKGIVQESLTLEKFKKIQEKSWVILPKALDYFEDKTVLRVVSFEHGNLDAPGTTITRGDPLG